MPGPVAEERNIEEIVSELKGIAYENWIRKWIRYINELLRIYGVEDPQEAVSKLIREYHAAGATIGSPATAFTFTDEPFLCRVKYLAKLNTWIVERCEKPLLLVKVKPGKVYYQLIPGEK